MRIPEVLTMLPFLLYFVTGVLTGFHVYTLLWLAVYGGAFHPLELVSFLGSFCLLIAAYVSLFRPYAAARLALVASLAIWCFYGPAIAKIVRTRLASPTAVSRDSTRFTGPQPVALRKQRFQLNSKTDTPRGVLSRREALGSEAG